MVAPVVYQKQEQRQVYFPGAGEQWYQFEIDMLTGGFASDKITVFKGGSESGIINRLPSAPPTFLRSGYGLLANYPENRSAKLSNEFRVLAALKNGKAALQIMGIKDYHLESDIAICVSEGCFYHIVVEKVQDNIFEMRWTFKGPDEVRGRLEIKEVVILDEARKWKSA